jgi:hypothetical protein
LCRVIDNDWHAHYTAVNMIIIAVVTAPAPTGYAAELAVAVVFVFEVPFVLVGGPVTTGCLTGLD